MIEDKDKFRILWDCHNKQLDENRAVGRALDDVRRRLSILENKSKMKEELTKQEPKYKVGQSVWMLDDNDPVSYVVDGAVNSKYYLNHPYNKGLVYESLLFPTRQSLIEHQIEYWRDMLGEELEQHISPYCEPDIQGNQRCQHDWSQPIDRGDPYNHADRFFIRCKKCYEEKTVCVPIPKCQHEWDGNQYDYATKQPKTDAFKDARFLIKCIKCGEFYR